MIIFIISIINERCTHEGLFDNRNKCILGLIRVHQVDLTLDDNDTSSRKRTSFSLSVSRPLPTLGTLVQIVFRLGGSPRDLC